MEDIFEELAEESLLPQEVMENAENSNEENKDVEETKRMVKPKKKVLRPTLKLDATRLSGPRGFEILESSFENVKFKGKGYELEDLTTILSRLQHWAHRLYPKMKFEDCIERIEELGTKRAVSVNMVKYRLGMNCPPEEKGASPEPLAEDPFDRLLDKPHTPVQSSLTEEQRARMLRNRLLAEEKRMAKIKMQQSDQDNAPSVVPGE